MIWQLDSVVIIRENNENNKRKESVNIGTGNGLSPDRRQAITWTNEDY